MGKEQLTAITSPKDIEDVLGHKDILRWASLLVNYLSKYPEYFKDDQVNIFIKSPPGTGKTAWAFALRNFLRSPSLFSYLVVSNVDPSEFGGATFAQPQENGQLTLKVISRAEFYRLSEEARAQGYERENKILFFDELGNAPPHIQSAVLNGISSGLWGGYQIKRPFCVIATGNPVDASETAQTIAEPMRRRFIFFNLPEPDVSIYFSHRLSDIHENDFVPGFITSQAKSSTWNFPDVPDPLTILAHRLAWSKLMGRFSLDDDTMLTQKDNLSQKYEDYGWDSPASREMLVQALSVLSAANAPTAMLKLCAYGAIGISTTNRFFSAYPKIDAQVHEIADHVRHVAQAIIDEYRKEHDKSHARLSTEEPRYDNLLFDFDNEYAKKLTKSKRFQRGYGR